MTVSRRWFLQLFIMGFLGAVALQAPGKGQSSRTVRDIAKGITVQIQPPGSSGSGVLIHRIDQTYFVLTAKHVIAAIQPQEEAYVITPDQTPHPIELEAITPIQGMDVALVKFKSDRDYAVASIGDSTTLVETDSLYVSGFPLTGTAITTPTFTITKGVLTGKGSYDRGYGLIYDSVTQTGMSGGPVLNEYGLLVGIHGLAEGAQIQGIPVKAGLNLGIPIQPLVALIPLELNLVNHPPNLSEPSNPSLTSNEPLETVLDRYYAVLPELIENREAVSLYAFMPIHKERFRYKTREGNIQSYDSRIVGATQFYRKSKARGEQWQIKYERESIHRPDASRAIVSHIETVHWSVWPGLIRGKARRREIYHWENIDGEWMITSGEEELLKP